MIWGLIVGVALLLVGGFVGAREAVKRERARCERVVRVLAGQIKDGRITLFSQAACACIVNPEEPVRADIQRPQTVPTSGMAVKP